LEQGWALMVGVRKISIEGSFEAKFGCKIPRYPGEIITWAFSNGFARGPNDF
jgi:hypothetical protein